MNKKNYNTIIEGLLYLAGSSGITIGELIQILSIDQTTIEHHITELNKRYETKESAFKIIETAQTYKLVTTDQYFEYYKQYATLEFNDKLSNSSLETLSIIAYNQPITRFEIEEKRGVMAGHTLKNLTSRDLVKVVGKSTEIGKPNLYGTTSEFLDFLGINDLSELPKLSEFELKQDIDDEGDLFSDVEDFKEIKKRLLSSSNIIMKSEEIELDDLDEITIKDLVLPDQEEAVENDTTTETNS